MKIILASTIALAALVQAHRLSKHVTTPPPTCPTPSSNFTGFPHLIGGSSDANTCSGSIPGSVLTRFTGIFFGDFTLTGGQDILGPLAVGGTFTAKSYTVNANHGTGSCSDPTEDLSTYGLVVGGEFIGSDIHVHGSAFLPEDTDTDALDMLDTDCEAYTGLGTGLFDFDQVFQNVVFLQKIFAAAAPTKKLNADATLTTLSGPAQGFDIITFNTCFGGCIIREDMLSDPGAFLLGNGNWNGVSGGSFPSNLIPVNVGSAITLINNQPSAGLDPCTTIWNFYPVDSDGNYSAGKFEINRQTGGQLGGLTLAAYADIVDGSTGNFAGLTIADNYMWQGAGVEMHDYNAIGGQCSGFVPCLPLYNNTPPIFPIIPDPGFPITPSIEDKTKTPTATPSIPTLTLPVPASDLATPSIPTLMLPSPSGTASIPTLMIPSPSGTASIPSLLIPSQERRSGTASIPTLLLPSPSGTASIPTLMIPSPSGTASIPTLMIPSPSGTASIPTLMIPSPSGTASIPTLLIPSPSGTASIPTLMIPSPSGTASIPTLLIPSPSGTASIPTLLIPSPSGHETCSIPTQPTDSGHATASIPTLTIPPHSKSHSRTYSEDVPTETPCEDEDKNQGHHHHHEHPPHGNDNSHGYGDHQHDYHHKGNDDSGSNQHHHNCGHHEDGDSGYHGHHHEDDHHHGKKKHDSHHGDSHHGDKKHGKGDNSGDYKKGSGYEKDKKYHGQSVQASASSIDEEAEIFSYEYGSTMTGAAVPVSSNAKISANAASKSSSAAAASKTGTTSEASTVVFRGLETLVLSFVVIYLFR